MFDDSTIVLTGVGAEGQVGEIVAQAFADLGATLVLVDRTAPGVEARAASLTARGHRASAHACDLTNADAISDLVEQVRGAHGDSITALVHMAGGFAMSGPVAESSIDVWQRQIAINLTSAYLTTRAFLPMLRPARGAIVLFASEAALPGAKNANRSAYAVAKSGVVTLTQALAAEEREHGVRINAVAPSSIRTALNVRSLGENVRYVEREQVAATVTFLCSSAAGAITGSIIPLS